MNRDIATMREVIKRLTQMLAGMGLTVTQRGTQAYVQTDPRTLKPIRVNIPYLPDNASPDLIVAIQGFIDHEVAHILFTDWNVAKAAGAGNNHHLHAWWNTLEDTFIERAMGKKFPGSPANIRKLQEFFIEHITKPALANCETPEEEWNVLAVPLMRALSGQTAFEHFLKAGGYYDHDVVKEFFARVDSKVLQRIPLIKSSQEALDIAKAILKAIEDQQQSSSGGKGKGQKPHENDSDEADGDEDSLGVKMDSSKSGKGGKSEKADDKDESDDEENGTPSSTSDQSDDDEESEDESESSADDEGDEADGEEENESDSKSDDNDEEDNDGGQGDDDQDGDDEQDGDEDEADGDQGAGDEEADGEVDDDDGDGDDTDDSDNEALTGSAADSDGASKMPEKGTLSGEMEMAGSAKNNLSLDADFASFDGAITKLISDEAVEDARTSEYIPYTKDFDKIEPFPVSSHYKDEWLTVLEDETRHMVGTMQKDVERMMAARALSLKVPGYRSGRLHTAGLHRLAAGDPRVFRRKVENPNSDTTVTLLIDNSGSMGGAPIQCAMTAAYALAQTLERVGLSAECLGFTTFNNPAFDRRVASAEQGRTGVQFARWDPIYIPIFKDYNERLTAPIKKRFADAINNNRHMATNIDGESVEYAALRMLGRKEKRKVMLVMSDGMPCGGYSVHNHLRKTVEDCKKMGIECVGIGIKSAAVQNFYPRNFVLNRVEDLPGAIMHELKRILAQ